MSLWNTYKTRRLNNPRWWLTMPLAATVLLFIVVLFPFLIVLDFVTISLLAIQAGVVTLAAKVTEFGNRLSAWTYANHSRKSSD